MSSWRILVSHDARAEQTNHVRALRSPDSQKPPAFVRGILAALGIMNKNVGNIRFQLEVNGESVCIAGIDGFGVLTSIITWAKRDPARFDPAKLPHSSSEQFGSEDLNIELGGLDSNIQPQARPLEWHRRALKAGDVVTIRILEPGSIDEAPPK